MYFTFFSYLLNCAKICLHLTKKRFWILMKLECKLFFTCITDVSTAIAKTVA